MVMELLQNFPEVFNMVLWVGRVNKDIVKKDCDEFVQVLTEKIVHHKHELCRGVGNTERHYQTFI